MVITSSTRLKGYRFPREGVFWTYHRFAFNRVNEVANGDVLNIRVQTRSNAKAAKHFLTPLIAQYGQHRAVITDKLRSYIKPIRQLAPNTDHRADKRLNNRIDGSHRPTRRQEQVMGRFKSQRQAQRFLAAHDQINTIFSSRRDRLIATSYGHTHAAASSL